jgi:hypothetical protein
MTSRLANSFSEKKRPCVGGRTIAVQTVIFLPFVLEQETERNEEMRNVTARSVPPQIPQVRTTRLDVAAFLLVQGFQIARVDFEGTTAIFIFDDPRSQGEAVTREFYNGAQVVASEYADSQKRIRDLLWEAKRRGS